MPDIRRSAGASEIKFLVDPATADRVRAWARQHLEADPHGSGPFGDTYSTTTLYLDTPDLDVFHRRGSNGRAKYRIRRYDNGVVFVERKLRTATRLAKRRTQVTLDDLPHLLAIQAADWPAEWFHRRMRARRLTPTCEVRYTRLARGMDTPAGPARLTVDDALHASPARGLCFGPPPVTAFLEGQAIMEMKFRQALPAVFKRLLEELQLAPGTVSKYRHALGAIGAVEPAPAFNR
jgi:hypothetical protein